MEETLFDRNRLEQLKVPFNNLCLYLRSKQIIGVYKVGQRDNGGDFSSYNILLKNKDRASMESLSTRWPRYNLLIADALKSSERLLKQPLNINLLRKLKLTPLTTWDNYYPLTVPPNLNSWINWFFQNTCPFQAYWAREHDACLLNTETQQMVFAQHKRILSQKVEYLIKPEEPAPPARTVLPRPIRKVRK